MIKIYCPKNEGELVLIKNILDGAKISYFVHNDNFGSLKAGPSIELLNQKTIMVDKNYAIQAKELIADFLKSIKEDSNINTSRYSLLDKLRMFFEVILFGWIMPGKKWPEKKENKDI